MNSTTLWKLARFYNGVAFTADDFSPTGLPVVRIRQLVDPGAPCDLTERQGPARSLLADGDLVFSWSGSLAARIWDRGPAWLNQHLFKVVPVPGVDRRWLRWVIEDAIPRFEGMMHGSAMTHLNLDMLRGVRVDVPPLADQQRIATFLDRETERIDALSSLRSRQLDRAFDWLGAKWSQRLSAIASGVGMIPVRRVLTAITDGPFGSSLTSDHYADAGARVIRLGNIGSAKFRDEDVAYIDLAYYRKLQRHSVKPGDLIIAGLGDERYPLGRGCIAPDDLGPAIVKADCFRLRLDRSRITHEYAAWAFSSPFVTSRVAELSRGATRARINLSAVRGIEIPIPDLHCQADVVAELSEMRAGVESLSQQIGWQCKSLSERRQALVTTVMTSQIDVSTASGVAV